MVHRARSKLGGWLGLAGLLLGATACADDEPGGSGDTASSSSGGSSSSTAGTSSTGPGVTSMATAADTTAADTTAADTTAVGTSTGGTTADGTSTGGTGSTGSTGSSTTGDGTSSDSGVGSSSSTGGGSACGNGAIEAGEQCDGADLQGFDCGSLGLGGGILLCDPVTCTFDTSLCGGGGNCGNGLINPGEQCDGANLQGFDCVSLGLGGGVLACDPITCTFDTSMCMPGGGTSG